MPTVKELIKVANTSPSKGNKYLKPTDINGTLNLAISHNCRFSTLILVISYTLILTDCSVTSISQLFYH